LFPTLVLLGLLAGFVQPVAVLTAPLDQQEGLPTDLASSLSLQPVVITSTRNDVSPPLRDIAARPPTRGGGIHEIPRLPLPYREGSESIAAPDLLVQEASGASNMPAPIQNFEGVDNVNGVLPPDTQGDVGPNHYVQMVNISFAIYDKTGALLYGPVDNNTLWTGFGGPCETTNDGDPITLYDQFAGRWLMSQFALPFYPNGPFYECIAISQTDDPTGPWNRYAFQMPVNKMNDYPKFGVWPDGYYMSVNQFNAGSLSWGGAGAAVFERDKMLLGLPANMVYFDVGLVDLNYGGMLPSDADGATPPPAGAPNYFAEWDDGTWIGPWDALRIWEFHVDWVTPANSTFGIGGQPNVTIWTANVDPNMCNYSRNCIPQPGGTRVDAISDRLMHRLQYRNFGGHEALVSNHTVDVGNDHAGIHWFELRDTGSGWTMYQQGVYAPDNDHRWMGSVAMDQVGNIALGYSVSSQSIYPSIRYTGRLASDPLGTLPQGETELIAGSGYQQHSAGRWGDYSSMTVDPVDDCTFWYTQEYYEVIGSAPWQTRIGSFRFRDCLGEPQPPSVGTFGQDGGSGTVGQWQNFTTTFTDPDGYGDIDRAFFLLNRQPPLTSGGLPVAYIQSADLLVLLGGGSCQPGDPTSLNTTYVTLDCANTSVSGVGDTLTIDWRVRPDACFMGGCGWNYAVEFVTDNSGLYDAGLVGFWRLDGAMGRVWNARPGVKPTEADLERLIQEVDAWR